MSLQDAMLKSILRAILARAKSFPTKLTRAARDLQAIRNQQMLATRSGYNAQVRWNRNIAWAEARLRKQIVKHSDKLPAILGDSLG